MNKFIVLSLIVPLFLFSSCHRNNSEKEKLIGNIHKSEKIFKTALQKHTVLYTEGRDLLNSYNEFIIKYPKDTNTPNFIYQAGSLYLKYLLDYKEAIKYFDELYQKYPDYRSTPEALFAVANVYNDFLKEPDKAKEYFELIIKKYPESRLAKDSEVLLRNLGKSDEDLWNDIQKHRK